MAVEKMRTKRSGKCRPKKPRSATGGLNSASAWVSPGGCWDTYRGGLRRMGGTVIGMLVCEG